MSNKTLKVLLISIFILGLLLCCCIFSAAVLSTLPETFDNGVTTEVVQIGDPTQTVAMIPVEGVITSQTQTDIWGNESSSMSDEVIRKINLAKDDDNVQAVILKVDSPGGEVFASKLIYNQLKEFKSSGKTLVVQMNDMAASGGYYISSPADEIVASTVTTTGSIGVIVSGVDFEGLYEKLGIREFTVVNSEGNLKVFDGLDDETSESYKILQSILDDVYNDFITVVADGRRMNRSQVIDLADGRIYSGKQAQELGLVDTLGELNTAKEATERLAGLTDPQYITYETTTNPFSLYSMSFKRILFPELAAVEAKKPGISIQYLMKI